MKNNFKPSAVLTADPDTETDVLVEEEVKNKEENHIVIYNDDVNTFDHVIDCLVEICSHERLQAIQCAHLIHNTGKCSVKGGTFKKLRPLCEALIDRGLSATIE